MKASTLNIRIDPQLKADAEKILRELGLSIPDAVRVFLHSVVNARGIPFPMRLPNEESKEALRQVREGQLTEYNSLEEMIRDAENW